MKILGDSAVLPQSTRQQITNADYADHQCSANVGALPEREFEGIEGDGHEAKVLLQGNGRF